MVFEERMKNVIYDEIIKILPILIAGFVLFYWNLGSTPINVWDESLYANIAQDMISYSNWLVPYSSYPAGGGTYGPFFEKFPLLYWLEALSFVTLGQSEFAARFHSATFGILSAVVIYYFGCRLFSRRAGFISAISFLTIPYIYAGKNAARQGSLETGMLFFGLCFIYFTYMYSKNGNFRWGVGWAIAAGLVVMSKGMAGGIFLIIVLPIVFTNLRKFIKPRSIGFASITCFLSLPWPLLMYKKYPNLFVNHIVRVTFERRQHYSCEPGVFESMCYPYLQNIWIQVDPIIYISVLGSLYLFYTVKKELIPQNLFVTWWAWVVVVFFTLTGNHPWYVIPAYPAFSLIAGKIIDDAVQGELLAKITVIISTGLIFAFSPRLGVIEPYFVALNGTTRTELAAVYQTGITYIFGVILFSIFILSYPQMKKIILNRNIKRKKYVALSLKTVVALSVLVFFVGVPIAPTTDIKTIGDREDSIKSKYLGKKTAEIVPRSETIYMTNTVANYAWSHFVYEFYSDRKITSTSLQNLDKNKEIGYAIIRPSRKIDREYKTKIKAKDTNFGDWKLINLSG